MGVKTRKLGNVNDQLVEWQAIHVADGSTALTAVAGRGYFIDTTSAAQTVNLPANASSSLGDTIMLKDYARKWGTNAVTLGSNTFDGETNTPSFNTTGQTLTFVHMGTTKGWSLINEDTTSGLGAEYISATGGTVTTDSDHKVHTFTGDGNFVVSSVGNAAGSNSVEYLVVAGGGGAAGGASGSIGTGGGGAGGLRFASPSIAPLTYPAKPLAGPAALPVSAQTYPVTVGGGGSGSPAANSSTKGSSGSNSVFSTITSAGGGGGAADNNQAGIAGGSGGGGSNGGQPGAGNTPPVSPAQGTAGGSGSPTTSPYWGAAGGGGAISAGQPAQGGVGGNGGDGGGFPTAFGSNGVPCGSFRYYAGGGGGGGSTNRPQTGPAGNGGKGGGAPGGAGNTSAPSNATANSGGGGGGAGNKYPGPGSLNGSNGGSGIVIIRYKYQN